MQLPGFDYQRIEVDGVTINTATAGTGSPVLLLHGYPQTHLMWHRVAPVLAGTHSVVVTDLRGYGDSDKPTPAHDDTTYSKRAMARDQLGVMRALGHERFAVVGHDRGARVAHRLALDAPEAVDRLAVLDIVPTSYVFEHTDLATAATYFHWFFLSTPGGLPERLISLDPEFWLHAMVDRLLGPGGVIDADVMAEYLRCFRDPATVTATCADYRSATTVDAEHSRQDVRAVACPTLVLWGEHGFVGNHYAPLEVWREFVGGELTGKALPSGHFLPEEAPDQVLAEVTQFLR